MLGAFREFLGRRF